MNTNNGFSFIEIKSISTELQRLYQDYEIKIETKIIFMMIRNTNTKK